MKPPELERCPSCDAPHAPDEPFCWMCHQRFWDGSAPVKRASAVPEREPGRNIPHVPQNAAAVASRNRADEADRWSQPFLVFTMLAIMTGLGMSSQAGSALLWLALVPALFVTGLIGFKRRPKAKPVTFGEKLLAAVMLLGNTVAILILGIMAVVIALVAVCFAIMAITGFPH